MKKFDMKKYLLKHNISTIKKELDGLNIKKIVRNYANSLNLHGRIKTIGWGNFGIAFLIDDKVIKLTKDLSEAHYAQKLLHKQFKHLPYYYDVKKINFKSKDLNLAFICLEKLKMLSENDKKLLHKFKYFGNIHNFFNPNIILDVKKIEEELSNYDETQKERMLFLITKLKEMSNEFHKYKINVSDFHENNIGWKDSNLAFFDMGISNFDSYNIKKTYYYK